MARRLGRSGDWWLARPAATGIENCCAPRSLRRVSPTMLTYCVYAPLVGGPSRLVLGPLASFSIPVAAVGPVGATGSITDANSAVQSRTSLPRARSDLCRRARSDLCRRAKRPVSSRAKPSDLLRIVRGGPFGCAQGDTTPTSPPPRAKRLVSSRAKRPVSSRAKRPVSSRAKPSDLLRTARVGPFGCAQGDTHRSPAQRCRLRVVRSISSPPPREAKRSAGGGSKEGGRRVRRSSRALLTRSRTATARRAAAR